ncbi:MAG: MFS transporter [Acidimicrobiia bacterium]|nr:MFS transporter [Acidimicrobiia bacterium]
MTAVSAPARMPPLARVSSGKVFYGWYVALACSVMMFVTVGVSYYGLSLFLQPLREEHGWSNGVVAAATGTFFLLSGVASFAAGPWVDRFGPRVFLALGIVLTALGATGVGFVTEIWHLYVAYALLAVAYGLGAVVPVSTLISRWFIHKRAKANMVSSTGVSLGGAVLVPLGAALIERGGLRLAAPTLGVAVALIALPVLFLVVSPSPAALNLEPDGGGEPPARSRIDAASQYRHWTRASAARTRSFWATLVAFFLCLGAQTAVLVYQIAFLQGSDKLGTRPAAALAVTTTTIGSIVARIALSMFADRLDKRRMALGLFLLQAVAIVGYVVATERVAIYATALVFGFTVGNVYMVQALLIGELFGLVSFGTVYGMIGLAGQIASGLALIGLGRLIDTSGYAAPFLALAAADVVAAVVVLAARPLPALVAPAPAGAGADAASPADAPAAAAGNGQHSPPEAPRLKPRIATVPLNTRPSGNRGPGREPAG